MLRPFRDIAIPLLALLYGTCVIWGASLHERLGCSENACCCASERVHAEVFPNPSMPLDAASPRLSDGNAQSGAECFLCATLAKLKNGAPVMSASAPEAIACLSRLVARQEQLCLLSGRSVAARGPPQRAC